MKSTVPPDHPLHRWFAAMVEQSFQMQVGIADPLVLEYVTDLLTDFIHMERINLAPDGSGRPIEDVAEMLCEAELTPQISHNLRRREYHRHIGDFTLFWTGVYPENLRRMYKRGSADELIDYFSQGKRSYAIASSLSDEETSPPAHVLRCLSDQFEYCVYGLGLVRKQWERGEAGSAGTIEIPNN